MEKNELKEALEYYKNNLENRVFSLDIAFRRKTYSINLQFRKENLLHLFGIKKLSDLNCSKLNAKNFYKEVKNEKIKIEDLEKSEYYDKQDIKGRIDSVYEINDLLKKGQLLKRSEKSFFLNTKSEEEYLFFSNEIRSTHFFIRKERKTGEYVPISLFKCNDMRYRSNREDWTILNVEIKDSQKESICVNKAYIKAINENYILKMPENSEYKECTLFVRNDDIEVDENNNYIIDIKFDNIYKVKDKEKKIISVKGSKFLENENLYLKIPEKITTLNLPSISKIKETTDKCFFIMPESSKYKGYILRVGRNACKFNEEKQYYEIDCVNRKDFKYELINEAKQRVWVLPSELSDIQKQYESIKKREREINIEPIKNNTQNNNIQQKKMASKRTFRL